MKVGGRSGLLSRDLPLARVGSFRNGACAFCPLSRAGLILAWSTSNIERIHHRSPVYTTDRTTTTTAPPTACSLSTSTHPTQPVTRSGQQSNLRWCLRLSFVMATATMSPSGPSVYPKSHVGFDSITNQIEKKLLKRGFQFNVICVGMLHPPPTH